MKYSTIAKHVKIKRGLRTMKKLGRAGKVGDWVYLAFDSRDVTNCMPFEDFKALLDKVIRERN